MINRPTVKYVSINVICSEIFAITTLKSCTMKVLMSEVLFLEAICIEFYYLIPPGASLGRDILDYTQFLCLS